MAVKIPFEKNDVTGMYEPGRIKIATIDSLTDKLAKEAKEQEVDKQYAKAKVKGIDTYSLKDNKDLSKIDEEQYNAYHRQLKDAVEKMQNPELRMKFFKNPDLVDRLLRERIQLQRDQEYEDLLKGIKGAPMEDVPQLREVGKNEIVLEPDPPSDIGVKDIVLSDEDIKVILDGVMQGESDEE